jgi:D-alanyl-lipoteichoic acid acyltransferase DltB (MBOAT superfamily)
MVCVSIAMMAVRMVSGGMTNWATWYFIIIGVLVAAIMIISISIGAKQAGKGLRCFKLDNNIDICLPRGKCFQAGLGKDDKICNIDDDEVA